MTKDPTSIKTIKTIAKPYRVTSAKGFRLKEFDPGDTGGFDKKDKETAEAALAASIAHLETQQDKLYAQDRWGLLLIFQAMDAAGKDGAIKHVMSGVNPQGCQGVFLQNAFVRGVGSRLSLALHEVSARTWPDRHFQSILL